MAFACESIRAEVARTGGRPRSLGRIAQDRTVHLDRRLRSADRLVGTRIRSSAGQDDMVIMSITALQSPLLVEVSVRSTAAERIERAGLVHRD
jgi:hypothetical protein